MGLSIVVIIVCVRVCVCVHVCIHSRDQRTTGSLVGIQGLNSGLQFCTASVYLHSSGLCLVTLKIKGKSMITIYDMK